MTLSWARPNQAGKAASGKPQTRARFSTATTRAAAIYFCPCCTLIQNRIGWISPGALNYVALRLDVAPAEIHGVASFYGMFSLQPRPPVVAYVCDDIACFTLGADKLCSELERTLGPAGSPCADGRATWLRSQCLGLCERAPAALVSSAGEKSHKRVLAPASAEAVQSLVTDAVAGRMSAEPDSFIVKTSVPQAAQKQAAKKSESLPMRLLHRISQGGARQSLKTIADLPAMKACAKP